MKKLLILGAGIYQVPLIAKAREMGLYTIAASYAGNYPGIALADEVWEVDTRDYQELIKRAGQAGIAGVCTAGTDVAVISLGAVCDALSLTGLSMNAARTVTDKALMKAAFVRGQVTTAPFYQAATYQEALAAFRTLGAPAMLKAVDSSGSRGITRVDCEEELTAAWQAAAAVTRKDYVLVESFITAPEIGVDGFVRDGELCLLLPHYKSTLTVAGITLPQGHAFPYHCSAKLAAEIRTQMLRAIRATGLDNCAVNADVLISGDSAYILEIGGRAGATCIPELISTYSGCDYYRQIIRQALGERPDFTIDRACPCSARLIFSPVSGVLTAIDQAAINRLCSKRLHIALDYSVGTAVEAVENGTSRIGQIIMETDCEEELEQALRQVYRALKINDTTLEKLWNES